MRKILIFVSFICLIALVGCAAMPAAPTDTPLPPTQTATPDPTATATVVPTMTTTPDIAKPAVSPNLLPVNNVSEVWENNAWVVKNADGNVTATWNTIENKWDYDTENLKMVFSGETRPNTTIGIGSALYKDTFVIPQSWETALPESNIDQNPIVPLGYIDSLTNKSWVDSDGNQWHYEEYGVDFRGIAVAEPASGDSNNESGHNIYVAGFTLTNPKYPDRLYTITVPISESDLFRTGLDLFPNGSLDPFSGTHVDMSGSDGAIMYNMHDLITILQNPKTIGRRMVLQLTVSDTGKVPKKPTRFDLAYGPMHNALADAIKNGTSFTSLDTRITEQFFRLPHDLHSLIQNP